MPNPFQAFWDYQVAKFHLQLAFWGDFAPWAMAAGCFLLVAHVLWRMLTYRAR